MSTEPVFVTVYIRPIDPPYRADQRYIICLDTDAIPLNYDANQCKYCLAIDEHKWYITTFPVSEGKHFFSISQTAEEDIAHSVDVFFNAVKGEINTGIQHTRILYLMKDEPRYIYFSIIPEDPIIGDTPLKPIKDYDEPSLPVTEITTNDPKTLSTLEAIKAIGGGLWSGFTGLPSNVIDFTGLGTSLISGFFTGILNNLRRIMLQGLTGYSEDVIEGVLSFISGSPEWKRELDENRGLIYKTVTNGFIDNIDPTKWTPDDDKPESILKSTFEMANILQEQVVGGYVNALAVEIIGFGQLEAFTEMITATRHLFGIDDILKTVNSLPMQKGVIQPYEYALNTVFPNQIPPYADLTEMVVKEIITPEEYFETVVKLGFNKEWSQRIYDKRFNPPSYGEIIKAHFRGAISPEELPEMLKRVELDPRYNDTVWLPNITNIPPYTDLIRLRTREVIPQSMFSKYIRWWGFDAVWAKRLWDGHFMPPNLGDIILSFRRQVPIRIPIFNEETGEQTLSEPKPLDIAGVRKLMELVDLDPRYNDIFLQRLYIDPSARMGRWLFEGGTIDEKRLRELVHRSGYRPKDESLVVEMLRTFQARRFRNRYATQLLSAFIGNTISEEELRKTLESEQFIPEVGDYIVKIGNIRRQMEETPSTTFKPKLMTIAELKKAFMLDKIDKGNITLRLLQRGYNGDDVTIIVSLMELDKVAADEGGRQLGLTITQLLQGWRFAELSEDELRTRLQLKGMDTREINILINTKKKQWDIGGVAV